MDEFDFDPFGGVEVIEAISGCPTVDPLTEPAPSAFRASLDPALVVGHAVPHCVLSQLLRPLVAAFLSSIDVALNTAQDAAACISSLTLEADGVALALRGAAALPHLTTLTVQCLSCRALRAEHFAPFETAAPSRLHTVDLSYCVHLTDTAMRYLAALPNLTSLDLTECTGLTKGCLPFIATMAALEVLDLWKVDIEDDPEDYLSRLPRLRDLTTGP